MNSTHSNSSPIRLRNSSTNGLFSTYTWRLAVRVRIREHINITNVNLQALTRAGKTPYRTLEFPLSHQPRSVNARNGKSRGWTGVLNQSPSIIFVLQPLHPRSSKSDFSPVLAWLNKSDCFSMKKTEDRGIVKHFPHAFVPFRKERVGELNARTWVMLAGGGTQ